MGGKKLAGGSRKHLGQKGRYAEFQIGFCVGFFIIIGDKQIVFGHKIFGPERFKDMRFHESPFRAHFDQVWLEFMGFKPSHRFGFAALRSAGKDGHSDSVALVTFCQIQHKQVGRILIARVEEKIPILFLLPGQRRQKRGSPSR